MIWKRDVDLQKQLDELGYANEGNVRLYFSLKSLNRGSYQYNKCLGGTKKTGPFTRIAKIFSILWLILPYWKVSASPVGLSNNFPVAASLPLLPPPPRRVRADRCWRSAVTAGSRPNMREESAGEPTGFDLPPPAPPRALRAVDGERVALLCAREFSGGRKFVGRFVARLLRVSDAQLLDFLLDALLVAPPLRAH